MKKLAVIGRGTAGSLAVSHFLRWTTSEIDWYFDDNIKPTAVGEGSTIEFPQDIYKTIGFLHSDLEKIDGTVKLGIHKINWGKEGKTFYHNFNVSGYIGYHFNANKLQNYILSKVEKNPKLKINRTNVNSHNEIDADFIIDCSGRPKSYEDFHISEYITVNAVHVNQCYWDYPRFQHTIAHCAPYGWVFLIPLVNRCSVGYMYNKNYNKLDDIKDDIKNIFEQYNLTPSDKTNSFEFENYYRKENFTNRVAYNGNASFFLEPMEATSITCMSQFNKVCYELNYNGWTPERANDYYLEKFKKIEFAIAMHYYPGSVYNTAFWKFAKERGEKCMNDLKSEDFRELLKKVKYDRDNNIFDVHLGGPQFGHWISYYSWKTHIMNLNVLDDFIDLYNL